MSFSVANLAIDINDYEIGKILGRGGSGIVFLAKDEKNGGRNVALKVIKNEGYWDRRQQRLFLCELCIPSYLNLPGIVKLLGFRFPFTEQQKKDKSLKLPTFEITFPTGRKEKIDFSGTIMVTELMPHTNLEDITNDYIKNRGVSRLLNPTVRSKILFGVAATMKRLHAANVLHRCLEFRKIYLDENVEPRIADFGMAAFFEHDYYFVENQTVAIKCAPIYRAPEVIMDPEESPTEKVDVYNYAFIIYKTFTVKLEFDGKKPIRSAEQFMMNIGRRKRPKRSDSIPDQYWELIEKCWQQKPEERPSFEQITQWLRSDDYAIEEFGQKTDLNALHEYWDRIDPANDIAPINSNPFSMSTFTLEDGKSFKIKDRKKPLVKTQNSIRKSEFEWKRH